MGSSDHAERRIRLFFDGSRFSWSRWSAVAEIHESDGWSAVAKIHFAFDGYPHRHAPFRWLALWRAMRDHRRDQRTRAREARCRGREIRETIHLEKFDG